MDLHSALHHPTIRSWGEQTLHARQLIYPVFVSEAVPDKPVKGFEPNMQWGKGDDGRYTGLVEHLEGLVKKGLTAVMLFGVVTDKNNCGSMADHPETPVIACCKILRQKLPALLLCLDVCLCEYTDHGHCGLLREVSGEPEPVISNAATIPRLVAIALAYAAAGAHLVCPSDMMDQRVGAIRQSLTAEGYSHVSVMAYTSKKASVMYAPFRDAVASTFKGDRQRYQQPPSDSKVAMRALRRDVQEGADMVIVKPSLFYADIIRSYAQEANRPVVAYVVSGEYKMLYDYGTSTGSMEAVLKETHLGLLRAGANVIITYFTPLLLDMLREW